MIFNTSFSRRRVVGGAIGAGLAISLGAGLGTAIGLRRVDAQEGVPAGAAPAAGDALWPKFNLNTATEDQFRTIPGVGDQMVREFFEYRPYTGIAQFRQEIGKYVDERQVAAYERYVFAPVDSASVDAATLQQLPGLSEESAADLAGVGPYDSTDAFLTALGQRVSAKQLVLANDYLVTATGTDATWIKFNLDTATEAQLRTIPGVGDQMLREFLEYRPYSGIQEFRQEIGKYVDEAQVTAYEAYLFAPIDAATADVDSLQQLPGVGEEIAAELVEGGPYVDAAGLLEALRQHVSPEQAEAARAYLSAA